jgi:hypothetical protein
MTVGLEADAPRLRRALRDLVALSTVPAAWVGREQPAIAAGLENSAARLPERNFQDMLKNRLPG